LFTVFPFAEICDSMPAGVVSTPEEAYLV